MVGRKEKRAMEGIVGHMELVASCCHELAKAYDVYLRGSREEFEEEAKSMRRLETQADDARRQVELAIYSGAFMPIHREDYLNLAEMIDKVADDSVAVVNLLQLTRIKIPKAAKGEIADMIEKTIQCVDALQECVSICIVNRKEAASLASRIEELEETIDKEEFDLRAALYGMKISGYDKILLNDLVEKIGDISDTAEDASDLIVIMISKRG